MRGGKETLWGVEPRRKCEKPSSGGIIEKQGVCGGVEHDFEGGERNF